METKTLKTISSTMADIISNYKYFFKDQAFEAVQEQEKVNKSMICNLFKSGVISLGFVDNVQQETGKISVFEVVIMFSQMIIIRFIR